MLNVVCYKVHCCSIFSLRLLTLITYNASVVVCYRSRHIEKRWMWPCPQQFFPPDEEVNNRWGKNYHGTSYKTPNYCCKHALDANRGGLVERKIHQDCATTDTQAPSGQNRTMEMKLMIGNIKHLVN